MEGGGKQTTPCEVTFQELFGVYSPYILKQDDFKFLNVRWFMKQEAGLQIRIQFSLNLFDPRGNED